LQGSEYQHSCATGRGLGTFRSRAGMSALLQWWLIGLGLLDSGPTAWLLPVTTPFRSFRSCNQA
jgi:hypothetical protein